MFEAWYKHAVTLFIMVTLLIPLFFFYKGCGLVFMPFLCFNIYVDILINKNIWIKISVSSILFFKNLFLIKCICLQVR